MRTTSSICALVLTTASGLFSFNAANAEPSKEGETAAIQVADLKREKPIDFEKEVLPLFKQNCLACHNATDAKADLILETPEKIRKGGENGPAVVPGKAGESLLMKAASHQVKPFMPPRNNKAGAVALKPEELGLIKLWIDQGATGVVSTALGPVHWQPLPSGLHAVNAVALTRDGQFAACGRGNQIFIYRVPTGQLITRLTDPELLKAGFVDKPGVADRDIIQSLAFSPDGTILASGAYRSLKLWQRQPVAPALDLPYAAAGAVETVALSGDGKFLATGGADGSVKTWDAATGKLLHEFRGHTAGVSALAFSPDYKQLASASLDKSIRVWDAANPNAVTTLQAPGEVRTVLWVGDKIISGGGDNLIRVWLLSSGAHPPITGLPQTITTVALSPDHKRFAVASEDEIQILDPDSGKLIKQLSEAKGATALVFLKDTNLLGAASKDKHLKLWNIEKAQSIADLSITNTITALAASPGSLQIAVAAEGAPLAIYTVAENALKQEKTFAPLTNAFTRLLFSPDTTLLFGSAPDGKFFAGKVADGASPFTLAHEGGLRSFALSPDGKLLATGGEKGDLRFWNLSDGKEARAVIGGLGAPIQTLDFTLDGKKIVAGTSSGEIQVVDLTSGVVEQNFTDPNGVIRFAACLGEKNILTFAALNSVRFWSAASVSTISGHAQPVTSLAAAAGGKQLLSGSKDGSLRLWNLEDRKQLRQMDHGGEVTAVAARVDGKRFASSGMNNAVKIWNADDGKLIAELKGDRQAQEFVQEMDRGVNFARSEVAFHKSSVDTAEKSEKSETEALKKTTEAKEKAAKVFAEKSEAQKKANEAKAAADKALADLKTAIQKAKEGKGALEKSSQELAAAAKTASEKAGQIKTQFDAAAKAKEALYHALTDAAFQAKLASLAALEAKARSDKEAGNKEFADAKIAAEKAANEKEVAVNALIDKAAGARTEFEKLAATKSEADKTLADAQAKAKAAADAFAGNEKLLADADKSQKDGEEKIKAAEKQLADATSAFKQAEGLNMGAAQAFESTKAALKKATETVALNKAHLKEAENAQSQAERSLESAKKSAAETEKPIRSLAFSPNSQLLVYGGEDGALRTASADNGKPLDKLNAHPARVLAIAFLPNGNLASGSADQTVKIWNPDVRWEFSRAIGKGDESSPLIDRVMALDFSPDGKWLASGGGFPSRSGEMKIWNVADGSLVHEFKDPHSDTVVSLDFSPDQKYLASGGADKFLRVFDLATGKQVKAFEGHTHHVQGVSWEHNGRTLASAGADKVVKVWDFVSGEQRKTIEGHAKELTSIHFIGYSNEALISAGDNRVRIIRDDGNEVRSFSGMNEFVSGADITPDGKTVIAGSLDGILRIWNGVNGEALMTLEPPKDEAVPQIAGKQ